MKEKIGAKSLFQQLVSDILLYNTSKAISENEARQIAMMILEHYLGTSRNDIVLNKPIHAEQQDDLLVKDAVQRVAKEEPVQYVLGEADFYGRKFKVTPSVLIPRRETEELVYLIVRENTKTNPTILDIGTGSGCIAVTLKGEIPEAEVHAWDISEEALTVAKQNAAQLQSDIFTKRVDIFSDDAAKEALSFDIIVSNPPYVRESEMTEMHDNVLRYEPETALFVSDERPLLFYERITALCTDGGFLKKGGVLYFEINEDLAKETAKILIDKGLADVKIIQDMQKKDRFISGMLSI